MLVIIYILIILSAATQSASTKMFTKCGSDSTIFNALKALTSVVLLSIIAAFNFNFHLPTLLYGLGYGASLSLSMFAGYQALRLGPMALSSMLVSFSVILPLIWGITVCGETLTVFQYPALGLLFLAIFLTNANRLKPSKEKESFNYGLWITFVAITFLCNGVSSILQKQYQTEYPDGYTGMFMLFSMLLCAVIFSALMLKKLSFSEIIRAKGKRYALISGTTNGLYSLLTLILAGMENASVLFPIISAGTILASLFCGRFIFKEKLRLNHYAAIATGIAAVVLMKL